MLLGMFLHRFGFSRKLVAASCDRMDRVDPGEGNWSCFFAVACSRCGTDDASGDSLKHNENLG